MLFQGLNFMEGLVFGITLQRILELLSWNLIAITQGINFVGIMNVKLAFCMGKLRVKWLKTGAFPRQIPVALAIGSDYIKRIAGDYIKRNTHVIVYLQSCWPVLHSYWQHCPQLDTEHRQGTPPMDICPLEALPSYCSCQALHIIDWHLSHDVLPCCASYVKDYKLRSFEDFTLVWMCNKFYHDHKLVKLCIAHDMDELKFRQKIIPKLQ